MCATFELNITPEIKLLVEAVDVSLLSDRGLRLPSSNIQFISQDDHDRHVDDADWWLLQKDGKPSQYATFNTRAEKLYSGYGAKFFKSNRCIIPASAFIEGDGPKGGRYYHQITGVKHAIAFGGIYTLNEFEGKSYYSASVITCPCNPKFKDVHQRRIPMLLDYENDELIDTWLNPSFNDTEFFKPYLIGNIPYDLMVTPIAGARDATPTGEPIRVTTDE